MRNPVIGVAALAVVCGLSIVSSVQALEGVPLIKAVSAEEVTLQARIGIAVFDAATGQTWNYRGDERFPINSTHKTFACAALLAQVDQHALTLDRAVSIRQDMLVDYSPVTSKKLVPETMTFGGVCQASVSYSDNTAGNLVVEALGGPTAFNAYMRSLGDETSRLDRREPELNESTPGDLRDTTTPNAIISSLGKVLLGDALSASSRAELTQWMVNDQVAGTLLRAALPSDWKIADKTGAGGYGSRSIIAVIWPPSKPALVVGIYITQTAATLPARNEAIARIGAALKEAIGH